MRIGNRAGTRAAAVAVALALTATVAPAVALTAPAHAPTPAQRSGPASMNVLHGEARALIRGGLLGAGGDTAARRHGWGAPVDGDEFTGRGAPDPERWGVYDSPGHAGNGVRSPDAWQVRDGVVRVSGDAHGTTGGMSAKFDRRRYGRWEVRMRTSRRDPEYHPVLLLWPDSQDHPCDGEIDFAEALEDTDRVEGFVHYSCENEQSYGARVVDMTRWHHYAVEWTPGAIVFYLDGVEWFRDEDPGHQPPGPMHLAMQLDWFPEDGSRLRPSWMEVDWVRVYDLG